MDQNSHQTTKDFFTLVSSLPSTVCYGLLLPVVAPSLVKHINQIFLHKLFRYCRYFEMHKGRLKLFDIILDTHDTRSCPAPKIRTIIIQNLMHHKCNMAQAVVFPTIFSAWIIFA